MVRISFPFAFLSVVCVVLLVPTGTPAVAASYVRGDTDQSGSLDIADAVQVLFTDQRAVIKQALGGPDAIAIIDSKHCSGANKEILTIALLPRPHLRAVSHLTAVAPQMVGPGLGIVAQLWGPGEGPDPHRPAVLVVKLDQAIHLQRRQRPHTVRRRRRCGGRPTCCPSVPV